MKKSAAVTVFIRLESTPFWIVSHSDLGEECSTTAAGRFLFLWCTLGGAQINGQSRESKYLFTLVNPELRRSNLHSTHTEIFTTTAFFPLKYPLAAFRLAGLQSFSTAKYARNFATLLRLPAHCTPVKHTSSFTIPQEVRLSITCLAHSPLRPPWTCWGYFAQLRSHIVYTRSR